jgi:hypothetical protein
VPFQTVTHTVHRPPDPLPAPPAGPHRYRVPRGKT